MGPQEFRIRRAALGLERRELGRALGVSYSTIRKWEAGPQHGRLNRIPAPIVQLLKVIEQRHARKARKAQAQAEVRNTSEA